MKHYSFPSVRTDGLTLILGLGETGVAAAKWCLQQGADVRIADTVKTTLRLRSWRATILSQCV